jgi:PAS domain S-box-containing protein
VVDTNRTMRTLTRYSKVELEKINLTELCANPKQRKELIEDLRRHATVVDFLVRLKRKDGTLYNGSLTATRIRIRDKDFLQTTLQGTIEHKRAAENDKTLGKSKVLNVTSELTRDRT